MIPPYLAGREQEQDLISEFLEWLEDDLPPGRGVILYGPRGNGKTALMNWAVREARARQIGALKFSSKEIKSAEWLAEYLAVRPRWLRSLKGRSVRGVQIGARDPAVGRIGDALERRARRRGLVLAIDEAHTLAVDVGQDLLHAMQLLVGEQVPVMLLLAGTPDLPRQLGKMNSSFWGRSEILPLGLLEPDAAADAIRIPLEAVGRCITDEALARVVAESHGYPYFLQLWGELLWKEIREPNLPASLHDVDRARSSFERRRGIYYSDRHAELERAKLEYVAAKLAPAFAGTDKLPHHEVNEAIRAALEFEGRASDEDAVLLARNRLHDLGYIWSAGGTAGPSFRPGIPSLMQYMAKGRGIDLGPAGE